MTNAIATARKAKQLSQDALAKLVGVSRGAVGQWEMQEGTKPAPEHALKLQQLLGVSLEQIYGRSRRRTKKAA